MIKRLFDITVALIALLLFSLPMVIVGLMIRIKLGSPIFFVQERPGLFGKPFRMIKFRTMRLNSEVSGCEDYLRMTSFGSLLRSLSLDELPELLNVIRGDMSLVGPRPLLMEYLPLYTAEQARRHDVRPGVTGWAQVNGRNSLSWEEKFKLDIWYVENQSFFLDLKIILLTLLRVFKRDGISSEGHVTAEKFRGSEQ